MTDNTSSRAPAPSREAARRPGTSGNSPRMPAHRSTTTGIAAEHLDVFRAPYPTPESRRPLLQFRLEIPFDGESADVAARFDAYGNWLADSPDVPKLLLTVENGQGIAAPEVVDRARRTVAALEVQASDRPTTRPQRTSPTPSATPSPTGSASTASPPT